MSIFEMGKTCPIRAYGTSMFTSTSGLVLLIPAPRMKREEADTLSRGRIDLAFFDPGTPCLYFGMRTEHFGAGGMVGYGTPLDPLPADQQFGYMCMLVGVDAESQKVKSLRCFTFSRAVSTILWEKSQSWSEAWFKAHVDEVEASMPDHDVLFSASSALFTLQAR
jgi:hypothetical protein